MTGDTGPTKGLEQVLAMARQSREAALAQTEVRRAVLPLRYLRQQAHLTAPASNMDLSEKAIAGGFGVSAKLLQRFGISLAEVAERVEMPLSEVEATLAGDTAAPVVMLDIEDGVPPHLAVQARENTVKLMREAKWGSSLRFYRPSSLGDDRSVEDLVYILMKAGEGMPPEKYPIDGMIYPKIQHVHEVEWLFGILGAVEESLGLPKNRIRVGYLVEAGWAVQKLAALAEAGRDRLACLVLGGVDLAADVQIPEVSYHHQVVEYARSAMVATAGAVGVPAVDWMTLNFPVGRPDLTPEQNKERVLTRIRENFNDTRFSISIGMNGRWVGHPLQLFATMLAFRTAFGSDAVEAEVAKVEEFARAISEGKAAALSKGGQLIDIATDRMAREWLRRATAWGRFPKDRALSLGIITADEAAELP